VRRLPGNEGRAVDDDDDDDEDGSVLLCDEKEEDGAPPPHEVVVDPTSRGSTMVEQLVLPNNHIFYLGPSKRELATSIREWKPSRQASLRWMDLDAGVYNACEIDHSWLFLLVEL